MEKAEDEETREMQKRVNMYLEEAECVKEAMKESSRKLHSAEGVEGPHSQFTDQASATDSNSDEDNDNPIYNMFNGIGSAVIAIGRGVREWIECYYLCLNELIILDLTNRYENWMRSTK